MILLVFLCIGIHSVISVPVADDLIISLPDGQVQGTTHTTDNNKTFYGFQGIPYATPPLGSLRFEAPQPAQPWSGVWDATKDRRSCISSLYSLLWLSESEDCLFINVYTPSLKPAKKLPVMLWIYGGKFTLGSSRMFEYGPEFLIEEDVIVVSFNYRVGPFGFLSTGDSSIVGNAGLKDQALAIKWTHENIEYFGGDPEKITIFGESAGGASVGLQLVNKKVAGLYRAAILGSGSALTNWTIDRNPKDFADLLTTQLSGERYLNDTRQLKTFLQEKTPKEIINAANLLGHRDGKVSSIIDILPINQAWPVIEVENEDSFLTESPYELLNSGRFNKVPIVLGICANEAIMFLQSLETAEKTAKGFDADPNTIVPTNLRQNPKDDDIVIKSIQNLYLKQGETFSSNLVALTNYHSDNMFTKGVIKQGELTSKYVPVYFYQFSYYGRARFPYVIPGAEKAGHGAELPFLFNQFGTGTTDPEDILAQNRIVKLWANFAKFLNPTPQKSELIDVIWPANTGTDLQFLNINGTLEVRSPLRGASYRGWNDIYETYGKKPYITF